MTTPPVGKDVYARDLRLRLWDHGGDGPVALCLHGFLDTGRSFDAVAALLRERARVLCLDWRGHGESDEVGPGGSYHLLDHLKDLACVMQTLPDVIGRSAEIVLAHSMGGNVAMLLAGALPDVMQRLLLIDALGAPAEEPEEQPERLASLLRSVRASGSARPFQAFATVDDAVARLRAVNPGLSEQGARRMIEPVLRRGEDGLLRPPFDPRLRGPTPVRWPEAMWLALCRRVTARVRLLRAAQGYVPDDDVTQGRVQALRADVEVVADASHHLHVERPDVVARAALALLETGTSR